jgi:hypothetical protein
MENKTQDKKVNVPIGEIELPKIDISKHIGKKVAIESADTYEGKFGLYLKVSTKTVETLGSADKKIELKGSRIFGLQQDADGIYGYGRETKLGLFLKKMKVVKPQELIGKIVILQSQTSDSGTDFLSFN